MREELKAPKPEEARRPLCGWLFQWDGESLDGIGVIGISERRGEDSAMANLTSGWSLKTATPNRAIWGRGV
jgi:hypothetical protein